MELFNSFSDTISSLWAQAKKLPLHFWLLITGLIGISTRAVIDPDFGWHLRAGDYFREHGVPETDPFTYTMPSWHWVDHEWLSDVFLSFVYNLFGSGWDLFALSLLYGLIIAGAFYLAASAIPKIKPEFKALAAIIGILAALPVVGVRQQVLTLLGVAGVLWFYYRYLSDDIDSKYYWLLPAGFLLWANVHGGFVAGLGLLGLIGLAELIKIFIARIYPQFRDYIDEQIFSLKQWWNWVTLGIVSGLVTLINPYGIRLHYDLYLTLTDEFMYNNIAEWQPVTLDNAISHNYVIFLVILGFVLLMAYRKIEPTRWIFSGFLLWFSVQSWRNMPLFIIISVGFLAEILMRQTGEEFNKILSNRYVTGIIGIIVAVLLTQRFGGVISKNFNPDRLAGNKFPYEAVEWVKENPDKVGDRMFNEYGWGGYLLWRLPEYKVFIDGRMPFWRLPDKHIFKEQQHAVGGSPEAFDILEQYQVDWILVRNKRPLDWMAQSNPDWELVHRDHVAVIFTKEEVLNSDT